MTASSKNLFDVCVCMHLCVCVCMHVSVCMFYDCVETDFVDLRRVFIYVRSLGH